MKKILPLGFSSVVQIPVWFCLSGWEIAERLPLLVDVLLVCLVHAPASASLLKLMTVLEIQ